MLRLVTIDGNVGELGAVTSVVPPGVLPVVLPLGEVPMKSPTVLLAPVLVTTPEAVEFVIVPVLAPAKPPTVLLAPELVTAPEAVESAMVPALAPTKPPTVLLAPALVTVPEAVESVIVPVLAPTKPPMVLLAPALLTAPAAVESVMVPSLAPTKPPATLAVPTVTLPLAWEPVMAPLTELEATSPPAMLSPSARACDGEMTELPTSRRRSCDVGLHATVATTRSSPGSPPQSASVVTLVGHASNVAGRERIRDGAAV